MPLNRLPSKVRLLPERSQPKLLQTTERMAGGNWVRLREKVLRRDNGLCQCGECQASPHPQPADEVDHRIPLHLGGSHDLSNLQAMNKACHAKKTTAEAIARALAPELVHKDCK